MANAFISKSRTHVCDTTGIIITRATAIRAVTFVGNASAVADARFAVATLNDAKDAADDVFMEAYATAKNFNEHRYFGCLPVDGGLHVTVPSNGKIFIVEG